MDMRGTFRIALTALLMAGLPVLALGQSRPATSDPAGRKTAKPQEGFIDFTLKRMNPANHDYGQCLDAGRALLLDESIGNGYFWSNLVALSLLGCLFLITVFQYRLQARRKWNAARIVGQYEHALARSQAQLEKVTKSNHGLNSALAGVKESVLRSTSRSRDSHRGSPTVIEASASAPQNRAASTSPAAEDSSGISAPTGSMPQIASLKVEGDIVARINSVEQQLSHEQEDNKRLRQRLAEAERRLELGKQNNRQAKGE